MRNKLTRLFLLVVALVLIGCNSAPKRDPAFAPTYPPVIPQPTYYGNGAIYQHGHDLALFEDVKARRIGDVLIVVLDESTNSTKSASTTHDRTQDTTVTNPTVLGATPTFGVPGVLPLSITDNNNLDTSLSSSHEFSGSGDSEQSNSLSGEIAVTVADMLPNGNLVIRGEKRLTLNQGNEYVKISGIVRPTDVGTDNRVSSAKVADATIIYAGDGPVADSNKIAWLARFFISAIFPF